MSGSRPDLKRLGDLRIRRESPDEREQLSAGLSDRLSDRMWAVLWIRDRGRALVVGGPVGAG